MLCIETCIVVVFLQVLYSFKKPTFYLQHPASCRLLQKMPWISQWPPIRISAVVNSNNQVKWVAKKCAPRELWFPVAACFVLSSLIREVYWSEIFADIEQEVLKMQKRPMIPNRIVRPQTLFVQKAPQSQQKAEENYLMTRDFLPNNGTQWESLIKQ